MSDNHTVKFDFWAGFNANFILTILDDVKWRDGGCKIVQYMFKLSGALVKDNELLDEAARKTFVANANTAAGLLSTARRCFRFIRWLRNVKEIPGNLSSAPTTTVMVRSIEWATFVTFVIARINVVLYWLNSIVSSFIR